MKLSLHKMTYATVIIAAGCSSAGGPLFAPPPGDVDSFGNPDASVPTIQLACASNFCGVITDKNTGLTVDCGSCLGYSQCGDNGVANACGSACMPVQNGTPACDLTFGAHWFNGLAAGGEQFPGNCNYLNQNYCVQILNTAPCNGDECGTWWCCLNDLDAGVNPVLDGAVAVSDGGLP